MVTSIASPLATLTNPLTARYVGTEQRLRKGIAESLYLVESSQPATASRRRHGSSARNRRRAAVEE
jgi:hypothetical protein